MAGLIMFIFLWLIMGAAALVSEKIINQKMRNNYDK